MIAKMVLLAIIEFSLAAYCAEADQKKDEKEKPYRGCIQAAPGDAPKEVVAVLELGEGDKKDTLDLIATGDIAKKMREETGSAADVSGTLSANKKRLTVTALVLLSVRTHFVPGKSRGASMSALVPIPEATSDPASMIHTGVGDTFHIHEEGQPDLFDALVTDGNDEHLTIEVHRKEGNLKLDIKRDKAVPFEVAGVKYDITFPTTWIDSKSNAVQDQAMIIVRRPRAIGKPAGK